MFKRIYINAYDTDRRDSSPECLLSNKRSGPDERPAAMTAHLRPVGLAVRIKLRINTITASVSTSINEVSHFYPKDI